MADNDRIPPTPAPFEGEEPVSSGQRALDWAHRNSSILIYAGGAVLFLVLVVAGFLLVRGNRVSQANLALLEATSVYQTLTQGDLPAAGGTGERSPERWQQAADAFDEVADRYPNMAQGKAAVLYRANILFSLGRHQEAASSLEALANRDPRFARRFAADYLLAKCYEAAGDLKHALATYAQVRDRATGDFRGQVLVDMARCHSLAGDSAQAVELYTKVRQDFPDSALSRKADAMLALLGVGTAAQP